MHISLINKNALVGGSTQGIGRAIAIQLAKCGANVTLMARNEEKLKKTISELDTSLGQVHNYIKVDFYKFESFKKTIEDFFSQKSVDILVNNTNGPEAGFIHEKDHNDYQKAFDLLFQTSSFCTMKALPAMQKNRFGRIINVSSVSVKEPLQHLALSNTIRASLITWSKTLATDIAKENITINNILTGFFDTERLNEIMVLQAKSKNIPTEEFKRNTIVQIPAQRLGKPEEYGYLVAFLASDYAAYITGTSIPLDGGRLKTL